MRYPKVFLYDMVELLADEKVGVELYRCISGLRDDIKDQLKDKKYNKFKYRACFVAVSGRSKFQHIEIKNTEFDKYKFKRISIKKSYKWYEKNSTRSF